MRYLYLSVIFYSMLQLIGCATTNQATSNYATNYVRSISESVNPSYIIYHSSKSITELHFKFNSDKILYTRKGKTEPFKAKIAIHYRVYNEGTSNAKNMLDSATFYTNYEEQTKTKKNILGSIDLKLDYGKNYKLVVQFKDLNRNSVTENFFTINKSVSSNRDFFMLVDAETQLLYFDNYHTKNSKLCLISALNAGKKLFANYYQRDFPIAAPPFGFCKQHPFSIQT